MLTEDYGLHVAYSHYLPPLQALAARVPLAVCAQTVGPFRRTRFIARRIFEGADLVTLRETRSVENLRDLGIDPTRLEVTADLSFALAPASASAVDAALTTEGLDPGAPWIGLSLSGLVESHRRRRGASGAVAAELTAAVRAVSETTGVRVLLVPHVYGPRPGQDDRTVLTRVHEELAGRASMLRVEHEPEVLKGIISRCRIFVGARMHAVMAALSTSVPALALAYSHKAFGIMNDFGMDEWVIDAADVSAPRAHAAMMTLLEHREPLTTSLRVRAAEARNAAERNLDLLAELLARRGAT
jgi:colanic acid/amylovoran biosynthesis protein